MDHFNDLQKRYVIESRAEAAFNNLLANSEDFVLQSLDGKDYGTDCQIKVIDSESATNIRIHVQLKGTEKATNADGSGSI